MDWTMGMKEERAALKRIVALLFALADLAEFSCRCPQAVRGFVLWIFRRAERVASDLVGLPPEPVPAGRADGQYGDSPADALRLAHRFRFLACELRRQAAMSFAVYDEDDEPLDEDYPFPAFRVKAALRAVQTLFATTAPAFAGGAAHPAGFTDTS